MRKSLALILTLAVFAHAAEKPVRTTWQELGPLTQGKNVAIVLPNGVNLKGKMIQVENDKLALDVKKTSDKATYPKGQASLPRSSVRTLSMSRRDMKWTLIGTAIGLGGGLALAAPVNTYAHNEGDGAPLAVTLIAVLPAVLGFFLGRHADHKTITINVTD
jgi:hypothetical protein